MPLAIFGQTTSFAGNGLTGRDDGDGTMATFNGMQGAATDIYGNIYVANAANNIIRRITPAGQVSTLAGSGTAGNTNAMGTAASFSNPAGVAVDKNGNVYVANQGNNLIREISPSGMVSTLAGIGSAGFAGGAGTNLLEWL